jgi:hypothetical protein
MNKYPEHVPAYCNIAGCQEEACRWIDTSGLPAFTRLEDETFYLCPQHAEMLSPEDSMMNVLNLDTRSIATVELAIYSCSEDCRLCNR